jgi:hypothetical protein
MEGERSGSRSSRFNPGKRDPDPRSKGGSLGLSAGLDVVTKRKITMSAGNLTLVILSVPNDYAE